MRPSDLTYVALPTLGNHQGIQIVYKGITCYNAITRVITKEEAMKKLEVRELLEVDELSEVRELKERIDKILRMFQEGEPIEVTDHGKVIAHVVPVSEPKQSVEQSDAAAWADLKRIASELAPYWSDKNVDAVEIVRDVRRDL